MSLQKKNVIQEFMQEDYVPSSNEQIVRYITGKGNNLHEVENYLGEIFLVSMPKKYRGTIWLKRGDCIVIHPIAEGKKVLGEVVSLLSTSTVINLIESNEWPKELEMGGAGDASSINLKHQNDRNKILEFFKKSVMPLKSSEEEDKFQSPSPTMPPSSSEEEDSEEDDSSESD